MKDSAPRNDYSGCSLLSRWSLSACYLRSRSIHSWLSWTGSPCRDCWGLYSPPGIPPGIRLESRNSAGLILEFDIPAESAQNIMGIVFLLLCLVIPYRVRPQSMKKKLNSMEHPVDFHGTSPRSSREIIHVMISRANLNMWDSFPNKQTMFVWQSLSSHHYHLFFPPPSPLPTTTNHAHHRHPPCSSPPPPSWSPTNANDHQRPHRHHNHPKNKAGHPQMKMAAHIWPSTTGHEWQPAATYGHGQRRTEVSKLTSPCQYF